MGNLKNSLFAYLPPIHKGEFILENNEETQFYIECLENSNKKLSEQLKILEKQKEELIDFNIRQSNEIKRIEKYKHAFELIVKEITKK